MKPAHLLSLLSLAITTGCSASVTVNEPACDSQPVVFPLSQVLPAEVSAILTATGGLSSLCNQLATLSPVELQALNAVGISPTAPYPLPAFSASQTFDFSSELKDIEDVSKNLSVVVKQLSLTNTGDAGNPLSIVESVNITIVGPNVLLATYTAPTTGTPESINLTDLLTSDQILSYLQAGPVTLRFDVTPNTVTLDQVCALNGSINTTAEICVSATDTYTKSL
jgi:hypothetical protein